MAETSLTVKAETKVKSSPSDTLTMMLSKTQRYKTAGVFWTHVQQNVPTSCLGLIPAVPHLATSLQTLPGFNQGRVGQSFSQSLIILRLAAKCESFHR